MPRKVAIVERNMIKKGFQKTESHHHFLRYYTLDNKMTTIRTKMSHSNRANTDISDSLLSKMATQCKLNNKDFYNFIDCTLSQEGYETILIRNGYI